MSAFMKVCRACNSEKTNLLNLFASDCDDDEPTLGEKFFSCTALELEEDDVYPQNICYSCAKQLETAFKFRKQCERSYNQFKKKVASVQKESTGMDIKIETSTISHQRPAPIASTSENTIIIPGEQQPTVISIEDPPNIRTNQNDNIETLQSEFIDAKRDISRLKEQVEHLVHLIENQTAILLSQHDFRENHRIDSNNTTHDDDTDLNISSKEFDFPLSTIEEMNKLEGYLNNSELSKAMIKNLSKICGTSGVQRGYKIGLYLTKHLFSDELLTKYCWRGVQGSNKLPFSLLPKVRNLIYELLHLADWSFTQQNSDYFIQNSALKHSNQRLKRKRKSVAPPSIAAPKATNNMDDAENNVLSAGYKDEPVENVFYSST